MANNVTLLSNYRKRPQGSGAREAMVHLLQQHDIMGASDPEVCADIILAALWVEGFKVVPLTRQDEQS